MTTVTIEEAQAKLSELIDRLGEGDQLVITRGDRPVARLLAGGGEPEFDAAARPIWDVFAEALEAIPAGQRARLPVDGAERHDFYIYGEGNPTR